MRNIIVIAALLAASTARAADLPTTYTPTPSASPMFNWTGFGIERYGLYGLAFGGTSTHDNLGLGLNDELSANPHGPGIGGGFWYFYQPSANGLVFGVRAQIAYANLQGGATSNIGLPLNVNNATNYLG